MAFRKGSKSITVEKEGYLYVFKKKFSGLKPKEKAWQQKYIVLRKGFKDAPCLEWYESLESFISHKNSSKLKLDTIEYIGPVDMSEDFTYAFILFGEKQNKLQLAAKSDGERAEWINALNHCLRNGHQTKSSFISYPKPKEGKKNGYSVKLEDFDCELNKDILQNSNRDYVMIVYPNKISLFKVDGRGEEKHVLSWSLENIRSYDSKIIDQNLTHKLLSIDTGRSSTTGEGRFNFVTPHGDQIKSLISLNAKRTFTQKMNSFESSTMEGLYSSSPETPVRSMSFSPRKYKGAPGVRRQTIARDRSIPFHKYDSPENNEGYGHYIQNQNGYIDIFTDQKEVEENRKRNNSHSSVSIFKMEEEEKASYVDISTQFQHKHYVDVLPEESETQNEYVDVLAANDDNSHPSYVEVIGEEVKVYKTDVESRENSSYVEVLGDDVHLVEQQDNDVQQETYKSLEKSFKTGENFVVVREQHYQSQTITSHVISEQNSREEEKLESLTNVSSPVQRYPLSVTSQTSAEFSSLSSENDVFQNEINIVSEVFHEEEEFVSDVSAKITEDMATDFKNTLTQNEPPLRPKKSFSHAATFPSISEGLSPESGVNLSADVKLENEKSEEKRPLKVGSWHSDNGGDASHSENSSSTSESEDDMLNWSMKERNEDSIIETRERSHTIGELTSLRGNGSIMESTLLKAFEMSLTNPQHINTSPKKHPPLTREPQDQLIFELENPTQASSPSSISKKGNIGSTMKYICSNCGWYKLSKKRTSLRPNFRNKQCPRCHKLITKQESKSPKSKDKSSGGILDKIRGKRRSSDEKIDKRDPSFMKPERPVPVEPLFVKRVRDSSFSVARHSPSLDQKRSERGIAPSPLTAFSAVSLDAGESRVSVSADDGVNMGKNPHATSVSDSTFNNSLSSTSRTISPSPSSSYNNTANVVSRTRSSPPLVVGANQDSSQDMLEVEKIPRKNSGPPLPTLPEIEDQNDPKYSVESSPGTPPPVIPPRPSKPPLPPRHGSAPVITPLVERKLRRSQTDPVVQTSSLSPKLKTKNPVSRTLTDPGNNESGLNESIRNALSLGDLLDDNGESLRMKVVAVSLDDHLNADLTPPPLPPRRGSGQANHPPPLPRKESSPTS
ncbi:cyclin-dependent kinase 12-like isoform X3 [Xenia sp. Carnegie-2017]|uniref:cyclin-dependent kinase 12-like isoform X3 n=1 Tax=Xenia sp. Carnegie-2017 TaxID=2897299 RepID=UPI001F033D97|nr:cyclin-dependent kinase 12-like isoform X3 [Xenia sp. Carnegie-2017]